MAKYFALGRLPIGSRFKVRGLGLSGELLMANLCRARVKLDRGGPQKVHFTGKDGEDIEFTASRSRETSWSPGTEVELVGLPQPAEQEQVVAERDFDWFES